MKTLWDKLNDGEYIEVTYMGNRVAGFEDQDGVFVGTDWTDAPQSERIINDHIPSDLITHERKIAMIKDIGDSYKINDEFKPIELVQMLEDWITKFPGLKIQGLVNLKKRLIKNNQETEAINYDDIPVGVYDSILEEIVAEMTPEELLSYKDVKSILRDELNDQILETWATRIKW